MNVNDHYAICVVFGDNFESIRGVLYDTMIASIMMNGLLCYQVVVFSTVCLSRSGISQTVENELNEMSRKCRPWDKKESFRGPIYQIFYDLS